MRIYTLAAFFWICALAYAAPANSAGQAEKPAVVLVHGAFADGSSWSKVISLLQARGYQVVAVQNPLTSLADDVAATDRVINQQTQPVVLVGHSWGGVVITQAGNNPKVGALVYVAAFAPDNGQAISDAAIGFPPAPWESALITDEGGFLTLPASTVAQHFAQDLSPAEQRLIAATQVPWFGGAVAAQVTHAAWRHRPTWWVLSEDDHMIAPDLQAKMAANIQAQVTRVPTGHLPMLADPMTVAGVIIAAAEAVQSGRSGTTRTPRR